MSNTTEFDGFDPPQQIRHFIDNLIAHLEKKAEAAWPDAFLRLFIEKVPDNLYRISLTAELPHKKLASKIAIRDLKTGVRHVVQEVERQLENEKSAVRREHLTQP